MSQARAVLTSMTGSKVFVSASSLFGTTVITSILGFAFWAVAARTATPAVVGGASAAISVMQLVGSLGTLGLGTLLIGELGRRPAAAIPLVTAGLRVAGIAALVVGAVVGLIIDVVSTHPGALFAPGCHWWSSPSGLPSPPSARWSTRLWSGCRWAPGS